MVPTAMMTRRKRLLPLLLAVLVVLVVGYEMEARIVRSLMKGEAFYQGRPTGYWSRKLRPWVTLPVGGLNWQFAGRWLPLPSEWDWWSDRLGVGRYLPGRAPELWRDGFPLREGDESALPVLLEMSYDAKYEVRCIAILGFARVGKRWGPASGRLAKLARDDDLLLRTEAVDALKTIDRKAALFDVEPVAAKQAGIE